MLAVFMPRLINCNIAIFGMNGVNTELAKDLVLSGANITVIDNELISADDVETNFLFGPADLQINVSLNAQINNREDNWQLKDYGKSIRCPR